MLDVVIIGGGICGCSLLFELSRYQVKAALLEKENDVSVATTKANSAIVHAGYDPEPGSLMAKYNVEGNPLIEQLCADLDVLYEKCGSLVIGFTETDRQTVQHLYEQGVKNGVPDMEIWDQDKLHVMEPAVSPEAIVALYAPTGGIVMPWELASAMAEQAILGGAEVHLDTEVTGIREIEGGFEVQTNNGSYQARFVVNAAGIHSADISRMIGDDSFTIQPKRGEYFLLDTTQGGLVKHVVFPCPTELGKGVLVSPTVHHNIIVGPNSENVNDESLACTEEGLEYVRRLAVHSVPAVNFRHSIRNFAGLRAAANELDDFIVGPSEKNPAFFQVAGIKSPGLTSAPAIAKDVVRMLGEAGLALADNPRFNGKRKIVRIQEMDPEQRAEAVRQNPLYASIVCRCMTVTEGEIVDALHRPLPPRSIDAVKRRCTPGMGRCQGGFCGPRVLSIIARETGLPVEDIPQDRVGMDVIIGETKQPKGGSEA